MKITFTEAYSYHGIGHRDNQEDARFPNHDEVRADSYHSFVVCDGVGGSEKGEVASRIVAETLGNELEQNLADEPLRVQDLAAALDACYYALAKNTTPRNLGMATTMTMISANLTGVTAAHIGDSRIYHIRPGVGILYRSEDHSLVNALVKAGVVKEEEAENHPQSNVITRCLTFNREQPRDSATMVLIKDVLPGDYFVLMTDGVVHCIDDNRLVEVLSAPFTNREKCDRLRELSADSADNNTLWMVQVERVVHDNRDNEDLDDPDMQLTASGFTTPPSVTAQPGCYDLEASAAQPLCIHEVKPGQPRKGFFQKLFS